MEDSRVSAWAFLVLAFRSAAEIPRLSRNLFIAECFAMGNSSYDVGVGVVLYNMLGKEWLSDHTATLVALGRFHNFGKELVSRCWRPIRICDGSAVLSRGVKTSLFFLFSVVVLDFRPIGSPEHIVVVQRVCNIVYWWKNFSRSDWNGLFKLYVVLFTREINGLARIQNYWLSSGSGLCDCNLMLTLRRHCRYASSFLALHFYLADNRGAKLGSH